MGLLPIGMLTALSEMPGGRFADDGNGDAESPGGIFAGSSFISRFATVLELAFDWPLDSQAHKAEARITKNRIFLSILDLK